MSEQTIFTQPQETPAAAPAVTPTTIEIPQELSEFVGEGKKYATVQDALKSIPHAQKHIPTLEQELATVKAELEKRRTTEALLEEIKASSIPQVTTTTSSGVTEDTVVQLVQRQLEQRKVQEQSTSNISVVTSKFSEKFGDKAEEMYNTIAKETGLTVAQLNSLSATSPSAVLKLAGLDSKATPPVVTHPQGTINTLGLQSTDGAAGLSAKVPQGASTKQLVAAWKTAGQKVGKQA